MTVRHRISLVVFAYNQSAVIDDAVDSALAQVCEPIEIILSDDASPDDTHARMSAKAAAYKGSHQVIVRRNEKNLGMGEHFNTVMRVALGDLVILMAGDDISLPDRVARIVRAWDDSGQQLDLIASHVIDMAHDGINLGVLQVDDLSEWRSVDDWICRRPYVIGAAHAITRRIFERFGSLAGDCLHEDQVNTLRAICTGGGCTIDAPLVHYRRGGISGRKGMSGAELLTSLRRRTDQHLALHQQWQHDAQLADCLGRVQQATNRENQREMFMRALLADPVRYPALSLLWHQGFQVQTGWRLEKWLRIVFAKLIVQINTWRDRTRFKSN